MKEEGRVYQILSLLFRYPEEWLEDLAHDLDDDLQDDNNNITALLQEFIQTLQQNGREKVLEDYVRTFDFNEQTNLYLTSYSLQDKRERGLLLAELKEFYAGAEAFMTDLELPDYLPLVLEFCFLKPERAREILKRFKKPLQELAGNLEKIHSPYVLLMKALFLLEEI